MSYETNKNRDVFVHTITLPNATVTEENVLIILPDSEFTSVPRLVEIANKKIAEYGFDEKLNSVTILPLLKDARRWIEPTFLPQEYWPPTSVSKERVTGWVFAYFINLEMM